MDFAFLGNTSNGSNGGRGFGGRTGGPPPPRTPPEMVYVTVKLSQVVVVDLPYQTPRATAIRNYCASFLLDSNNRRLIYFRRENGWTNIALDATPMEPKLTMEPAALCRLLDAKLTQCPDVQRVEFKSESGEVVTLDQIDVLPFMPLVGVSPPAPEVEVSGVEIHALVREAINKIEESTVDMARRHVFRWMK